MNLTTSIKEQALQGILNLFPHHGKFLHTAHSLYGYTRGLLKYGDIWFPQIVHIEINTHCNRTCWYCPNAISPIEKSEMSMETFYQILMALRKIKWSGQVSYHIIGEPCKHPELVAMVGLTRRLLPKAKPMLLTNGDYLTEDLAHKLVGVGLLRSCITRHAPYSDEWDARIDTITKMYPSVFYLHKINRTHLFNVSNATKIRLPIQYKNCKAPTRTLVIRVNGDVSPCNCDYNNSAIIGNVIKQGVMGVIKSGEYQRLAKNLRLGIRPLKICNGCSGVG